MEAVIMIGSLSIGAFAYFMFWAFLGQVAMFMVQQKKYFESIKNQGGFSIKIWLNDNLGRMFFSFLTALILSPIAVLTIMNAPEGIAEFAAVGAGAMIDKTVESFTNKKK